MKKVFAIILVLLIVLSVGYFSCRNSILLMLIEKKQENLDKRNVELLIKSSKFSGLSEITLQGIALKKKGKPTLFKADTFIVDISLTSLLKGRVKALQFFLHGAELNIEKIRNQNNYSFLFEENEHHVEKIPSIQDRMERLSNLLFDLPVQNVSLKKMSLSFRSDSLSLRGFMENGFKEGNQFRFDLLTEENNKSADWRVKGMIDNSQKNLSVCVTSLGKKELPLIRKRYGITFAFDSIKYSLEENESDTLIMDQRVEAFGLNVQHWRLSADTIKIPFSSFNSILEVNKNRFTSDSTQVIVNGLPIYVRGSYNGDSKETELKAFFKDIKSDTFFRSLPLGLFNGLQQIHAKGTLSYDLYFLLPFNNPDSLKFNSSLIKKDFRILKYGETDLSIMNRDFTYTAYEKDKPVKSFIVGPSNPDFVPLSEISEYLKQSVMTSEDGSFFYHKGFNEDAFQQSIATNIKEKRFVRGGSTISMQLVKNVFLTRNKTISRKVEEALIVWLIENNRITSKERMFEVYLNIIEWGPGIYGIGAASQFYFSKKPSELSLEESIFLAMIIPRPKAFKYNFEGAHLKPYASDYYKLIAGHLLKKQVINEEQVSSLVPDVELKGPARLMLKSPVAIPIEEETEED